MSNKEIKPIKRNPEDAKKFYNKISRWYDCLIDRFEGKYRNRGIEALNVKKGDNVLEIGFGTGESILTFANQVGKSGKVYGVDISSKMYDIALNKVKKAGIEKRVELYCKDALAFEYESDYFSKIFLSFTLELFSSEDIEKILNNAWKMLARNGKIGIVSLSREKTNVVVKFYEKLHEKFPVYIDCRPIYVKESLKAAGFKIIKSDEFSMWGLPVAIVVGKKQKR